MVGEGMFGGRGRSAIIVASLLVTVLGTAVVADDVVEAMRYEAPKLRQGDAYHYSAALYSEQRDILAQVEDRLVIQIGFTQNRTFEGYGLVQVLPISVSTRTPEWDAAAHCTRYYTGECFEEPEPGTHEYGRTQAILYHRLPDMALVGAAVNQSVVRNHPENQSTRDSQLELELFTTRPAIGLDQLFAAGDSQPLSLQSLISAVLAFLSADFSGNILERVERSDINGLPAVLTDQRRNVDKVPSGIFRCGDDAWLPYVHDTRRWDAADGAPDTTRRQTQNVWTNKALPLPAAMDCVATFSNVQGTEIERIEYALRLSHVERGAPRDALTVPTSPSPTTTPGAALPLTRTVANGVPQTSGLPELFPLEDLLEFIRTNESGLKNGIRGPNGIAFGLQLAEYSATTGIVNDTQNELATLPLPPLSRQEVSESEDIVTATWVAVVSDHAGGLHYYTIQRTVHRGMEVSNTSDYGYLEGSRVAPLDEIDWPEQMVPIHAILEDAQARTAEARRGLANFGGFAMAISNLDDDSPVHEILMGVPSKEVNVTWWTGMAEEPGSAQHWISVGYDAAAGHAHTTTHKRIMGTDAPPPEKATPLDTPPSAETAHSDASFAYPGLAIGIPLLVIGLLALGVMYGIGRRRG